MAKNLVNGTNIIIEENGDNINMNLSSTYNTNLQQEINDSFKENNIYSTDETIIGTWIDGKPIYRKVIARNESITNGTSITVSSLNIDEVIKIGSINQNQSSNFKFFGSYYDSSNEKINIHFNNNNIQVWSGTGVNYTSTIWIEYTKTTD